MAKSKLLNVNGKRVSVKYDDPQMPLLYALGDDLGLHGPHWLRTRSMPRYLWTAVTLGRRVSAAASIQNNSVQPQGLPVPLVAG